MYTESCDGEIQILPLTQSATYVDRALCVSAKESGMTGSVRGTNEDIVTHTLVNPHMTSIVVENKVRNLVYVL